MSQKPYLFKPMLASKELPKKNGEWLIEPKYDGTRAIYTKKDGKIRIYHRSGKERSNRYPELTETPPTNQNIILDGEITALNQEGIPEFNKIQQRQTDREPLIKILRQRIPVTYYVFDVIATEGEDHRNKPLTERKAILDKILKGNNNPNIVKTPWVQATHSQAGELFKLLTDKGYEGIILKRPDSKYQNGRTKKWVKMKATVSEDLYIIGYTPGKGSRKQYFGALVLAEEPGGKPVSKVGTGFSNLTLQTVTKILEKHELGETYKIDGDQVILVEPKYKAEIEYLNGSKKNRFPSFKRIVPEDAGE